MTLLDNTGKPISVGDIVAAEPDFFPPRLRRCGIVHAVEPQHGLIRFIEASMSRYDPLFGHWYTFHADSAECTVIGRVDDKDRLTLTMRPHETHRKI